MGNDIAASRKGRDALVSSKRMRPLSTPEGADAFAEEALGPGGGGRRTFRDVYMLQARIGEIFWRRCCPVAL